MKTHPLLSDADAAYMKNIQIVHLVDQKFIKTKWLDSHKYVFGGLEREGKKTASAF